MAKTPKRGASAGVSGGVSGALRDQSGGNLDKRGSTMLACATNPNIIN